MPKPVFAPFELVARHSAVRHENRTTYYYYYFFFLLPSSQIIVFIQSLSLSLLSPPRRVRPFASSGRCSFGAPGVVAVADDTLLMTAVRPGSCAVAAAAGGSDMSRAHCSPTITATRGAGVGTGEGGAGERLPLRSGGTRKTVRERKSIQCHGHGDDDGNDIINNNA